MVTTKDNRETIRDCVDSILSLEYPRDKLKVLVVDASEDRSALKILAGLPVEIVGFSGNAPAAYNLALTLVRSDLVGFIDGDAKVDPDWLAQITQSLGNVNVAGAGGQIKTWNGQRMVPRCIGYELESRYNNPSKVVRTSTTNLVLKRIIIEKAGGFDETLDTGYDADIGYRIVKSGYEILFEGNAIVYHFHRPTLWSYLKQQYSYAKNDAGLYTKNSSLMLRDNVTRKWMIAQPLLMLLFAMLSLVLLFSQIVRLTISFDRFWLTEFWAGVGFLLMGSYLVTSTRLAMSARDPQAWSILLCILVTRAVAWTVGGVVGFTRRFVLRSR